jgi:hypothetical protein
MLAATLQILAPFSPHPARLSAAFSNPFSSQQT